MTEVRAWERNRMTKDNLMDHFKKTKSTWDYNGNEKTGTKGLLLLIVSSSDPVLWYSPFVKIVGVFISFIWMLQMSHCDYLENKYEKVANFFFLSNYLAVVKGMFSYFRINKNVHLLFPPVSRRYLLMDSWSYCSVCLPRK